MWRVGCPCWRPSQQKFSRQEWSCSGGEIPKVPRSLHCDFPRKSLGEHSIHLWSNFLELPTIPTLYLVFCVHSNSSDAAALTQMFLKGVRILCQLHASALNSAPSPTPIPAAPDSFRLRSSTQRHSSSPLSPPFNSPQQTKSSSFSFSATCSKADVGPLQALEPIWLALGSWFDLLAEEVRRTAEEEATCSECTSSHHECSLWSRVWCVLTWFIVTAITI